MCVYINSESIMRTNIKNWFVRNEVFLFVDYLTKEKVM